MYQFFETLYFHAHCEKGFFFLKMDKSATITNMQINLLYLFFEMRKNTFLSRQVDEF